MPRPTKQLLPQPVKQRAPRQERAKEKVELILEAAIRLMERDGVDALTTNAIADTAGVSIGTLYQYFKNKDAVLGALAARETEAQSAKVLTSFRSAPPAVPAERIHAVIRAVLSAYGGRRKANRHLMFHALNRGTSTRHVPLFCQLNELFTGQDVATGKKLSPADAFVLTHAVAGVLRSAIAQGENLPPREEIEASLTRLVLNFVQSAE